MTDINITIPDSAWLDDGDGRLFARLWINGTGHHLEAIPVRKLPGAQQTADDPHGALFNRLYDVFDGREPFETIEIRRKRYAVFLSPFCE